MAEDNEATTHADLYQRHEQDSSNWEEAEAVTGRPNDTPLRGVDKPAVPNTTLAVRAKSRQGTKQVAAESAEDKSVTKAATKAARKSAK